MSKVLEVTLGTPGETVNATASAVVNDPILSRLSDEPIKTPTKEEEKEARSFLKNVQDYLKSDEFVEDCNKKAMKTGQSPLKVGQTYIGKNCVVEPNNTIKDSVISDNCVLKTSYVCESRISENIVVGPFESVIKKSI